MFSQMLDRRIWISTGVALKILQNAVFDNKMFLFYLRYFALVKTSFFFLEAPADTFTGLHQGLRTDIKCVWEKQRSSPRMPA